MNPRALLWLGLGCSLAAGSGARSADAGSPGFDDSDAFVELRRSGREVVQEREADLDGDGLVDVWLVVSDGEELQLLAYRNLGEGLFRPLAGGERLTVGELHSWNELQLGAERAQLFDCCEPNPDEDVHQLLVLRPRAERIETVFRAGYTVVHSEEDAGRVPVRLVDPGVPAAGLAVEPAGSAWPRLRVRQSPRRLELRGADDRPVWLVVGTREQVYEEHGGRYELQQDRFVEAFQRVAGVAASASAARPEHGAELAVDGRADTAWIPDPPAGAALTVNFEAGAQGRLVRLVHGCPDGRGRLSGGELEMGEGAVVHLGAGAGLDPLLEARGDFVLSGDAGVRQIFLFLREPRRFERLVLRPAPAIDGEAPCVIELSLLK